MTSTYHVGQRVSFESALGTVRFIGPIAGTAGKEWLGVEWDDPSRGKHDGVHQSVRYFVCRSSSPTAASFIRLSRKADPEQSFVEAVHQKYATEITNQSVVVITDKQIMISGGKVAEEVGFDKIRAQLAKLHELKIVIVDGLRISGAETPGKTIRDVCPKIVELDLSRNLFETCREIMKICESLEYLKTLRLNGNRLQVKVDDLLSAPGAFNGLLNLEMDETLLSWEDICQVAQRCLSLNSITASSNGFESLPRVLSTSNMSSVETNLTSLTLEYNKFSSLADLLPLTSCKALEKLYLKGNHISNIIGTQIRDLDKKKFQFGNMLHYVDLSYNAVTDWGFVDDLAHTFPGLTALRFSHNPVYDSITKEVGTAAGVDDAYMLTLARLGNLKALNFSNITAAERTNAEMFYLSRIGRAMAAVSEDLEYTVTAQHKRFAELCETYGPPTVVRKSSTTINPDFLEARLIKFVFYMPPNSHKDQIDTITKIQEIPKGFDIYRVKGIVGKLFGVQPLSLRLIWETGEWDPVAGYEEEEGSISDDEEKQTDAIDTKLEARGENGKWMARELELEDGTRQVGFCVDGMEAKVRIEIR